MTRYRGEVGEDVTPEESAADEPAADEAAAGAAQGSPDRAAAPREPLERAAPIGFTEPTEADFLEADAASERARLAAQRMSWRRRTATGAILSGLALGFQQVFEDKQQDISIIVQTSGEPPTDLPVEAELEGLAPRRSKVKIRPWLLGDGEHGEHGERGEDEEEGEEVSDQFAGAEADAPTPDGELPESAHRPET